MKYIWDQIDDARNIWDKLDALDLSARSVLTEITSAILGKVYEVTVPEQFFGLFEPGSDHIIRIYATGHDGLTSVRIYTFTAVENILHDITFYVMRDGVTVSNVGNELNWHDYMAVGTHKYSIRSVDQNGSIRDSNIITLTTELNCVSIALTIAPENYSLIRVRRGQTPQISRQRVNELADTRFIGKRLPEFRKTGQSTDQISFSFTTTDKEEYRALFDMLDQAEPVVYRDHYGNRIIGVVDTQPYDYKMLNLSAKYNYIADYSLTVTASAYEEEVPYD